MTVTLARGEFAIAGGAALSRRQLSHKPPSQPRLA
jgi:hypothetical protein